MGRQRDELFGRLVVLKVVVVVADEIARRGAQHDPVEVRELRLDGALDGRFVDRALRRKTGREHSAGRVPGEGSFTDIFASRLELRALIPVDVIANGDGRVGRKCQGSLEQPAA